MSFPKPPIQPSGSSESGVDSQGATGYASWGAVGFPDADEALIHEVEVALCFEPGLKAHEIEVVLEAGSVLLVGNLDPDQEELALRVVRGVARQRQVRVQRLVGSGPVSVP